jgi:hypothetical protein
MGARNRIYIGIGMSYRPARLHRLAELITWNQFLGSIKVKKYRLRDGRYILLSMYIYIILYKPFLTKWEV